MIADDIIEKADNIYHVVISLVYHRCICLLSTMGDDKESIAADSSTTDVRGNNTKWVHQKLGFIYTDLRRILYRQTLSARVELPVPIAGAAAAESDEEPAGGEEQYEEGDDDFLVDFPDETDVSGVPPNSHVTR